MTKVNQNTYTACVLASIMGPLRPFPRQKRLPNTAYVHGAFSLSNIGLNIPGGC